MNAQELMDRHGPALIAILKNASPALQGDPEVAAFLNQVLDDEEQVALMPPRRPVLPGEEVFWWCVEQLLLLGGLARPAQDPYLQMALADLRAFAGRLERREPLPSGYRVDWLDAGDGLRTAPPTGLKCVR